MRDRTCTALATALLLALAAPALAQRDAPLRTLAEQSGFERTGRYAEVLALCDAFARRYPDAVRCIEFGTTPQGRPMKALVASRTGALTADAARLANAPVVLVQGGIHAGEIDGKDAGFLALRELLDGTAAPGALEKLVLVFVPVFNVDGHERFGRWNRPNQNGPDEMGWRTTAQNLNLNRDYMKADAPEMQAMLRLVETWDPLAYVDLHATNGAKFEHDIAVMVEPIDAGDVPLRAVGRALRDGTLARLSANGALPLPFYPSFDVDDDPQSGFTHRVSPPRFSQSYIQSRNRIGMLVETHSWKPYPHRVRTTRDTVVAVVEQVAERGRAWQDEARRADGRARALGGQPVALDYRTEPTARTIEFRGYAYTRTPSEISGATITRYDDRTPQVWRVPLRDTIVPGTVVTAPRAGYLVPAEHAAWVAPKLDVHGIAFRRLDDAQRDIAVQEFHADSVQFAPASSEGHQRATITGQWHKAQADLAAGALFVPIAQARARVLMGLLEPQAPDALAAWGGFNNAFERKEYMEDYVAEDVARQMLARDRGLREQFERRVREDAAFAGDPQARLEFFYRRHPSWDARYNRYPVYRLDRVPK